jgi:hypothetical protein
MPQSLAEWDELRPLGLRLAQIGEVAVRRQRHAEFCHQIGMNTPELGVRGDYTYGQVESGDLSSPNARPLQAEQDFMFANSPSTSL